MCEGTPRPLDASNISQKRCLFRDVSEASQKYLLQARKYLQFFKTTPQKWFRVISIGLLNYLIK